VSLLPPEIDLGWYRKPGFTARLVWDRSTQSLYVVRYVSGSMNSTIAFEMLLGGCDLEDLPPISVAWAEDGPGCLLALSEFVRPVRRQP
jgi:hypothetical protein